VNGLISRALKSAEAIVKKHRATLSKIANTLVEKETLEREEFNKIIQGAKLKPVMIV
jgi:ATP-dependent Zn protease